MLMLNSIRRLLIHPSRTTAAISNIHSHSPFNNFVTNVTTVTRTSTYHHSFIIETLYSEDKQPLSHHRFSGVRSFSIKSRNSALFSTKSQDNDQTKMKEGNKLIKQPLNNGDKKGVEPNEKPKATMAQTDQLISKRHANQMMEFIKTNKYDDAKKYFHVLQKNRQANVIHYSIAITYLCSTSNEKRELISKMITEGLHPNVVTFNTLINQLLYEGDKIAAQHVVDVEMPAEGVEPDEKTKATMAQADQLIGQKHTNQMMEFIKTNKYDDAKQYFQMLQKSGQANIFHYNIAITYLCSTSNEKRELISKMKTE